ncbi:peptidase [Streptomyces piniterrae]|uniref:Peptidase n=1 Tax=Streptomyces piniterrae TaxID=2571125 RepID=A0A4U0NIH7_9ACTN|nr:cupredoxin domain-containing protein [Streptomyces piniterrae]TJZ54059.1 peptidase [Streptomyces piniterrae]
MTSRPTRLTPPATLALLAVGPLALLTACAEKAPEAGGDAKSGAITVQATDDACKLSRTSAPAGSIGFKITNGGNKITEFYLFSPDNKVVSEVEGIGPGTSRSMTVKVTKAGSYTTACKPGMVGEGIRGKFTVTAKRHG